MFHQLLDVEMGAEIRLYLAWPQRAAAQQTVEQSLPPAPS